MRNYLHESVFIRRPENMLLIETTNRKIITQRAAPRRIFCVIENACQSRAAADDAARGIFTNAGLTLNLGRRIDFRENPLPSDEEWRIEWFKFYFGLDLAHAFRQTADAKYLRAFEYLVSSFIRQIPVGLDTTDVAARRVQNWIYAWRKIAESPVFSGFSKDFENEILDSIKSQIAFIVKNLTPERNHRTLELYALFIAALALPEIDESGDILRFSIENLHENLLTDMRADGVQREQSSDYHLIVLRSFLGVKKNALIFDLQLPKSFDGRLEKACEFAMHIHRPDGEIPALSDGDTGSFLDLLELAAELFSREDFLYVATKGKKGRVPKTRNAGFETSGYFFQRSGWGESETKYEDERFLVFDCGPVGDGGHGHYDLLSVEIAANGKPLIADAGRYTYSEAGATNWRHFFKGTRAHNTVCVDEKDQTEYRRGKPKKNIAKGEFIERVSRENLDVLCGKAVSPLYDAVHTRRVFFVKNEYWIIWDALRSGNFHRFDLRFHLTPDAWNHFLLLETDVNKFVRTADLALIFPKEKNLSVEPGWYSPKYGIKQRIPCACVVEKSAKSVDFFTLVKPLKPKENAPRFEVTEDGTAKIFRVVHESDETRITDFLSCRTAGENFAGIKLETSEVKR